jgi:hypothetical protein
LTRHAGHDVPEARSVVEPLPYRLHCGWRGLPARVEEREPEGSADKRTAPGEVGDSRMLPNCEQVAAVSRGWSA